MFCLPKELTKVFIERLKSGEITPEKLSDMTSAERRTYFTEFMGEGNAKSVNALFESKLLLKNQQQGIINWARQITGIKPEIMRDILSRVERMTSVLEPHDLDTFLEDLAEQKLGVGVTMEEAGRIAELAKAVSENKDSSNRMDYGRAKVAFYNYVNGLKELASKKTFGEMVRNPKEAIINAAGTAKAINASMDNSAIGRQLLKTLWSHPGIWAKNAAQSFRDITDTFGGKAVMDEVNADILSRPTYDLMRKAKLSVGAVEEAFPTSLPEKIPFLGQLYKASENAYTAAIHRTRADVFDKYIDIAKKSGIDVSDKVQLESIGRLVNSLTGRGNLGRIEPIANTVNSVFFSPRFLKSNIDFLTAHQFEKGVTPFVRKQAAINLVKVISGTAAVLTIANAIAPGSVETDPTSSDFGKIKIGDTRFDISGGMGGIITLAMRLLNGSSKSSTTGISTPLNSGKFGSQTSLDVVFNFFENKLSPVASVIRDIAKGRDFNGNKPTLGGELYNLSTPLSLKTYTELQADPNSANVILSLLMDELGINTNTYSSNSDWNTSSSVELQQFKQDVGPVKFKEANAQFNKEYGAWFAKAVKDSGYQKLSDADKQALIMAKKASIKNGIFNDNSFIYRRQSRKSLPSA
jgi:hypothetical protein